MTNDERVVIRERLEKIAAANGGRLTPDLVVEDAQNPESPLHGQFDWDVERSAMRSWLERARDLIGSVHVIVHSEQRTLACPVWVRDPSAEAGKQGYVTVVAIRDDRHRAAQAVEYECARALACLERARAVASTLGLGRMVDEVMERVDLVMAKARRRTKAGVNGKARTSAA